MASVEIATTTFPGIVSHLHSLERAGTRLYWVGADATDLVYYYKDPGESWTGRTVIHTNQLLTVSAKYDADNGRLNIAYGGGNSTSIGLFLRAITSNVATGTPGALTTETAIVPSVASEGVQYPYIVHSATGTNPRYWIIGQKWTSATTIETRAWFVAAGSAADTAGNWSTTNFTDLGANLNAFGIHMGAAVWWTVGGADKLTFVFMSNAAGSFEAVTFDPTAATPTPGTVTAVASGYGNMDYNAAGVPIVVSAFADYLVFGALDVDDGMWDFYKTVDGTTWTQPTGWSNMTAGRGGITRSGSDFYWVTPESYGAIATTVQALKVRKITTADNSMSAALAFSDTAGNGVTLPETTGTDEIRAVYRASTATPWSIRYDSAVAGQLLRPDADVTTSGWTATPLHSKLSDSSDATVITATAS